MAGCTVCPDSDPDRLTAALAAVLRTNKRIDGRTAVRELDENLLAQRMIQIYRLALKEHTPGDRAARRRRQPRQGAHGRTNVTAERVGCACLLCPW